jgi:hypothetical protein
VKVPPHLQSPTEPRTLRAERLLAHFVSLPLLRDNVFRAPMYLDGRTEKEVCDVLLLHRGQAIVVSLKAQERPRTDDETARWLRKNAARAVAQLGGAYRTLKIRDFWCDHDILGRKEFQAGEVLPCHGVALLDEVDPKFRTSS